MARRDRTVVYWNDGQLADVEQYADEYTDGNVSAAVRELVRRGLQPRGEVDRGDGPETDGGVPTADSGPLVVVRDGDGGTRTEPYDRAFVTDSGTLVAWDDNDKGSVRVEFSPEHWVELRSWHGDDNGVVSRYE